MTRILLLRHGETTAPERFHGCESDVGLSVRGFAQAEAAARLIAPLRPGAVYCSGLRRAMETAAAIARACGRNAHPIEALHERRMGPLSGQPRAEFFPLYEQARARWEAGELDFTHDGAESLAQVRDRVVPVVERLAELHTGATIAVVAHGVVIRALLCALVAGLGPADFGAIPLDYVRTHDLRVEDGGWRLAGSFAPDLPTDAGAW